MMRTRLIWFTLGFSASAAAISQLVWRDLLVDRYALSNDMKKRFEALEQRIHNLETIPNPSPVTTIFFMTEDTDDKSIDLLSPLKT